MSQLDYYNHKSIQHQKDLDAIEMEIYKNHIIKLKNTMSTISTDILNSFEEIFEEIAVKFSGREFTKEVIMNELYSDELTKRLTYNLITEIKLSTNNQ